MTFTKFGVVRSYDNATGEGIIAPQDGTDDVVVARSAVRTAGLGQIARGQVLGFELAADGRHAENLWASWSNR